MKGIMVAAVLAAVLAPAGAADPDPPPVVQQISELRREVADLRAAVARVEARLTPPAVATVPAAVPAPAVAAPVPTAGPASSTTRTTTATDVVRTSLTPVAAGPAFVVTHTLAPAAVWSGGTECAGGQCSRSGPVRRFLFGR